MDTLTALLGRTDTAQSARFAASPGLFWTLVACNVVTAAALVTIPVAIVAFTRQRPGATSSRVAWLLCVFALASAAAEILELETNGPPDWGPYAALKVLIALASVGIAVAAQILLPRAARAPSLAQLESAIAALEVEISKRRSAEDQITEIEQSLAATLASIGAGFIATDRSGSITRMNGIAEELTGWSESTARGRTLWDVLDLHERPVGTAGQNPLELMVDAGWAENIARPVLLLSSKGTRTALDLKITLTHASDQSVSGMTLVFRDMSRLVQAELESSRLAAIVESSSDAIIGKLLDGRITSWNRAAETMFGYTPEEAIGQSVEMLIPPERADEEMRILANLARGQTIPAFDTLRRAKDGRVIQVSLAISPIRDAQGRIVGASKIARDVTEERRAQAALRESQERLRFTLESVQIGDWELDVASGYVRRSAQHDLCFGYTSMRPEWTIVTFLEHVHPDDRAFVMNEFRSASTAQTGWRVECRIIWPDQSTHWIRLHGITLTNAGEPTRLLGIVTDITAQRMAEESRLKAQQLEAENRQIQIASQAKSQFLANMSHELRTPLTAIIGFGDLLYKGVIPLDSPKAHEFLGYIGTSGRHLLQLINDVLDLSKVESGKFEFFPEVIDLAALLKEVQDILLTGIESKAITVTIAIDPALTEIRLDPARLKQILYNYLSNAIKYTPHGGQVVVRAFCHGPDHVLIEVEDSGIGITPADLPRLFVQFQQLEGGYRKRQMGSGLGLALTRRLVEAQGGSVGVRSTPGRGSVFHAVLNRIHGTDEARAAGGSPPRKARMLVVEHEHREQANLIKACVAEGFQVDRAATGGEALARARSTAYDTITLDLCMPDQSGLSLLEGMRAQGASAAAQVVTVSIAAADGDVARFSIANILSKPIRSDEILAAMETFRLPEPGRANVMVIDDDPMALDLMRSTLTSIGIDAIGFQEGEEALRALDSCRPDAIILDLMMPGIDGFEVLSELQRRPEWRDTPVFIWTNMILTDEELQRLSHSAQSVLSKGGGRLPAVIAALRRRYGETAAMASGPLP